MPGCTTHRPLLSSLARQRSLSPWVFLHVSENRRDISFLVSLPTNTIFNLFSLPFSPQLVNPPSSSPTSFQKATSMSTGWVGLINRAWTKVLHTHFYLYSLLTVFHLTLNYQSSVSYWFPWRCNSYRHCNIVIIIRFVKIIKIIISIFKFSLCIH